MLYMNLREGNDVTGFPARDTIPSTILTDFPRTGYGYGIACYAFFVTLEEHLATFLATGEGRADITRFTARNEFFTKVAAKYLKVWIHLPASTCV